MKDELRVTGAILAAGRSSRMGRAKALLPAGSGGPTFVACLMESLAQGGVDEVLVVVRPGATAIRREVDRTAIDLRVPVRIVENGDADRGQLSSVLTALAAVSPERGDGLLIVPVDMPLVPPAAVTRLLAAFRASDASIVRAVHAGRHGHPVIFARAVFDELQAADPALGARSVVRAHAPLDVEMAEAGVVEDVDTPEDYDRLFGR